MNMMRLGTAHRHPGGYIITTMITSIYVGMMSRVGVVPNVRPEMPRRRLTLRGPRVVMAPHGFLSQVTGDVTLGVYSA